MTYDHSCAAVLALGLLMFASCAPPALDSSVLLKKPTYDLALTDDDFTGLEGMELTEDDIKVLTPRWDDFDQIIYTLGLVVRENKAQKVREETAAKEQERLADLAKMPGIYDKDLPKTLQLLTSETYSKVFSFPNEKHIFLEIYADWCGHCKSAAPEYKAAAEAVAAATKEVIFTAVNGDKDRDIYSKFPSSGYPSFYLIKQNSKNESDAVRYDGARQKDSFIRFVNQHAGTNLTVAADPETPDGTKRLFKDSKVHVIEPYNFFKVVGAKHCLVYVYANWCKACQAFAPVYEHIAEKFEHVERVRIAALNSDEAPELIKQYGVTSLPAYFFFKKGADHKYKPDQITGEVNPFSLVELVNERTGTSVLLEGMEAKEYAELSEEEEAKLNALAADEEEDEKAKKDGFYSGSAVVDLSSANFDETVFSGKHAVVEFFAPWCGFCKSLKPTYSAVADAYQHHAQELVIGAIDADEHQTFVSSHGFNVRGYPTIYFFAKGQTPHANTPEEYAGDFSELDVGRWVNKMTGLRGRKSSKKADKPVSAVGDAIAKKKAAAADNNDDKVAAKVKELENKLAVLMEKKKQAEKEAAEKARLEEALPPASENFVDSDEELPPAATSGNDDDFGEL